MTTERDEKVRMRNVPVDWEALEDAFENNAHEVHSYLHLISGEVLRVVDGIADPEMHSRIASDNTYLRIESVSSREQYRWMERFIQMVDNAPLRGALAEAIDGKGAFRRFKDVLMAHSDERERWFVFRSERLRVFMEAWLSAHAIVSIARPEVVAEAEPNNREALTEEALPSPPPRKKNSAEVLRKQIRELCEGFGSRDLDRVFAFAEFIKARRVARNSSARSESSEVEHAIPEPPTTSAAAAEPEPPTSEPRKMTVVR